MQQRNELCLCGSGKKYKRCCDQSKINSGSQNTVVPLSDVLEENKGLKIQLHTAQQMLRILYQHSAEARSIIDRTH